MKKRKVIVIVLLGPFLLFVLGCLILFFLLEPWVGTSEEIGRFASPDSALDAVIIRTNPGAMSSFGYRVFVVPAGSQPKREDEVLHGIKLHGMRIEWKEPRVLEIHYDKNQAEITYFKDSWQKKGLDLVVEIRRVPHGDSGI